jgi:hypothetical protein
MLVTRPLFAHSMSIMRPGVQTTISHPARVLAGYSQYSGVPLEYPSSTRRVPSEHADHSAGRANDDLACKSTHDYCWGTQGYRWGTQGYSHAPRLRSAIWSAMPAPP